MPENDSQQNDSQQEQEMHDSYKLRNYVNVRKRTMIQKVALKYRGKVRIAPQDDMVWQLKKEYLCGNLAIEWIKEHIRGGDLVRNVLRFTNVLAHKEKWSEKDKLFEKNIDPVTAYGIALSKFCRFKKKYTKYSYASFKRGHYQIIATANHAIASCVYNDGTLDLYDPEIGEVRGASSVNFVIDYLNCIGVAGLYVLDYIPRSNHSLQQKEMKKIYYETIHRKNVIERVALKYGGTPNTACQFDLLYQKMVNTFKLRNVFMSYPPTAWKGICGILATEWIKEHIRGGNFVDDVVRFTNVLAHKEKWSENDKIFEKNIRRAPHMKFSHSLNSLSKFCKFECQYHYNACSRKYAYSSFNPGQYQIIYLNAPDMTHAMASCVRKNGLFDLFDPDAGEVRGASSAKIIEDYLNCIGVVKTDLSVMVFTPRCHSLHEGRGYPGRKVAFV